MQVIYIAARHCLTLPEAYAQAYQHWQSRNDRDIFNMLHNMTGEALKLGLWDAARPTSMKCLIWLIILMPVGFCSSPFTTGG